jgi:RHS repeat-associated protein
VTRLSASYAYSPYGETTVLGPDEGNPLQYTGRENDGTGLYYYRARYFDPLVKAFLSEDLIGFQGGLNLYAYVGNAPTMYGDALGLHHNSPGGDPYPKCAVDDYMCRAGMPKPPKSCCDREKLIICLWSQVPGGIDCVACVGSLFRHAPSCVKCAQTAAAAAACYRQHCGPEKCKKCEPKE